MKTQLQLREEQIREITAICDLFPDNTLPLTHSEKCNGVCDADCDLLRRVLYNQLSGMSSLDVQTIYTLIARFQAKNDSAIAFSYGDKQYDNVQRKNH